MYNFWLRKHKEKNRKSYMDKAIDDLMKKAFINQLKQVRAKNIWIP